MEGGMAKSKESLDKIKDDIIKILFAEKSGLLSR